ncbi:MAG TPA: hypothetical protein VHY35_14080 [Stellaceae bacterium]|jgi:hypothetical protein|nr:hypothetical protein [Stellaceae bacterium]
MPAIEPPSNPGVAIERSDVSPRLVAMLAGGIAVFCLVSALAIMAIYPHALSGPSDAPRLITTAPRLQVNPAADLAAHRTKERAALTSYGWVDRQRGTVRIPIEQAMEAVAAAGIKDWPGDAK